MGRGPARYHLASTAAHHGEPSGEPTAASAASMYGLRFEPSGDSCSPTSSSAAQMTRMTRSSSVDGSQLRMRRLRGGRAAHRARPEAERAAPEKEPVHSGPERDRT